MTDEQSSKKPIKNIYIFLITTIAIILVVWGNSTVTTTIKNQQKIIELQEKILVSHIDDIKQMDSKSQEVFNHITYLKTNSNALKNSCFVGMFMILGGFLLSYLAEKWIRKAHSVRTE